MIAVNQKAPHFITQYCLDRLRDKGRIVNIGSLGGRSALPPFAAYAATKRALQSLTMSTAVVVAPRGITCNLVAPGAVDTEFRSEEHTSELQSLMRISYAVFCLKKKNNNITYNNITRHKYPK